MASSLLPSFFKASGSSKQSTYGSPFIGSQPTKAKDPLSGFISREVKGKQVRQAMEKDINPFTSLHYGKKYKELLEERKALPAYAQMDKFYRMFSENQVIVIVGETGTGKSTQIPQFVAYSDLPHKQGKIIACTQPRRLAAKRIAERVAGEMGVSLGKQVGYTIRFEDATEPGTTFLKYMTDGMLLREIMADPGLSLYSTIILDEAHERTLATDVLMGLLKSLLKERSDLKLIIMSATLDAERFQTFFGDISERNLGPAPLLTVKGRAYSVDERYLTKPEPDYFEAAVHAALMVHRTQAPGDVLLFLTGEEEVEDACRKIKEDADILMKEEPHTIGPLLCIPLYSSMQAEQQLRISEPAPAAQLPSGPPGRKIIIATNIAETSLTIPGIVYVIDPGFSKQKMYDPRTRLESLQVLPISKASAKQRTGRAGRTCPGKCFRLYTKDYFKTKMKSQTPPEILTSNLANTVLTLVKIGIKNLAQFDFIDSPEPMALTRAFEQLCYLAALDEERNLTDLGSTMAEFPIDPQMSKMLIVSPRFNCSSEVLTIVSMLSVPNVFLRPPKKRREADQARERLSSPVGDHVTLLRVFNGFKQNNMKEKWAYDNFLSERSLKEAANVRTQLERIMNRHDIPLVTHQDNTTDYENICRALSCGFFMQVAYRSGKAGSYFYRTVKDDHTVVLHPSCGLRAPPEWVVFNELVRTKKSYIRTVTTVRPTWLLKYVPRYYDPKTFQDGETKKALLLEYQKQLERLGTAERSMEYVKSGQQPRSARSDSLKSLVSLLRFY